MIATSFRTAVAMVALAGSAYAADLPRRAAPPSLPLPPVFTWTGFHVGTQTGYAFSERQTIRTVGNDNGLGGITNTQANVALGRRPSQIRSEQDGFTSFGGGIGYDHQFSPGNGIVVGVAADATLTDLDRGSRRGSLYVGPVVAPPAPDVSFFRQRLDYLATVRGRIGYAFDRFLVYGTGGFAFGDVEYRAAFLRNTDFALAYAGRFSGMETGYVYGGGIEYAIPTDSILAKFNLLSYLNLIQSEAVTLKVEYLRYDLGSRNVVVAAQLPGGPTGSYTSRFKTEGNLIRGGFTYRFGGL